MKPTIFAIVFRIAALSSAVLLSGLPLAAQSTYTDDYTFTTLAGTADSTGSANGTGAAARFYQPYEVALDGHGNAYVTDSSNNTIRKIAAGGVVTTVAGLAGVPGAAVDGPVATAQFRLPVGICLDHAGNIYIADTGNNEIRLITPAGTVSTLAGVAGLAGISDGTGGAARFRAPYGIAIDATGSYLYVADGGNNEIRKVAIASGNVTTLAGSAAAGSANGTGAAAQFFQPLGVAVDLSGNVYVADGNNGTVRTITPGGVVTTLAGTANGFGTADGTGAAAQFRKPSGVTVDASGNVYVTDALAATIRKITPAGVVTTLGGVPNTKQTVNGTGADALFELPFGIAIDGNGNLYVTDISAAVIRLGSPPAVAPAFTVQPVPVTIANNRSAAFSVAATGIPAPTYQWSLNGAPIAGATDPILLVGPANSGTAGAYTCTATNSVSSVTSNAAGLTVNTTINSGRLINLSARAAVGTGNNILIGGFGVQGAGTKQLLVRGVGPALSAFFNTELVTPQLVMLDNGGAVVATNIGWGNAPVAGPSTASEAPADATTNLMNSLGAYTINPGSADTAMVLTMPAGNNTAQISGVGGTSGIALCEIYDADTISPPSARLINISARADVGTGNNILIGGFAISGATAETVLIRAVGPGLNDLLPGVFPLSAVLNQPVLTILDGTGAAIYSNTVWGGDATIAGTFATTGAFSLNPAHADSVVLVSLPPGNYTAQVSGLNSGVGIALCEIYEVQ